eukprot:15451510-Alexandrium_andersonii.AAC.1
MARLVAPFDGPTKSQGNTSAALAWCVHGRRPVVLNLRVSARIGISSCSGVPIRRVEALARQMPFLN